MLAVGRRKEAEDILAAAEKENGRCERDRNEDDKAKNEEKAENEEKAKNEEKAEKEGNSEAEPAGNIFDLVRTPHLRKSTLIM